MKKCNEQIRAAAKNKGVFLYSIAEALGVSENTFNRWLRHELPENKKRDILTIIDNLAMEEQQ